MLAGTSESVTNSECINANVCTSTWVQPVDQKCFLPGDSVEKDGWLGEFTRSYAAAYGILTFCRILRGQMLIIYGISVNLHLFLQTFQCSLRSVPPSA
jgi:hypothetical protein